MRYVAEEDNKGNKIYRECCFINKTNWDLLFEDKSEDTVIEEKDIPENCFIVDKEMGYIVRELNMKGYETMFSCQGHYDYNPESKDYSFSVLYVVFKLDESNYMQYAKNLFELPKCFHFEVSQTFDSSIEEVMYEFVGKGESKEPIRTVGIYANTYYANMLAGDEYAFKNFNKTELTALAGWVHKLPDLTRPEVSEALYDIRYIDHDTAQQCGFDFESVQEYAADIKESYDVISLSMQAMEKLMYKFQDHYKHLGERLASLKLVDDIREVSDIRPDTKVNSTYSLEEFARELLRNYAIDDPGEYIKSLYGSCPTEENYREIIRAFMCYDINSVDLPKDRKEIILRSRAEYAYKEHKDKEDTKKIADLPKIEELAKHLLRCNHVFDPDEYIRIMYGYNPTEENYKEIIRAFMEVGINKCNVTEDQQEILRQINKEIIESEIESEDE